LEKEEINKKSFSLMRTTLKQLDEQIDQLQKRIVENQTWVERDQLIEQLIPYIRTRDIYLEFIRNLEDIIHEPNEDNEANENDENDEETNDEEPNQPQQQPNQQLPELPELFKLHEQLHEQQPEKTTDSSTGI
jgi:hypothetical protein